jgi:hypothetical protein
MLFTSLQIKQGQHMTLQFHPNYQDNAIPFPEADLRAAILQACNATLDVFGQHVENPLLPQMIEQIVMQICDDALAPPPATAVVLHGLHQFEFWQGRAYLHATLTSQNVFGQTIHFYFQTDPNDPENIAPHPVAEVLSVGHDGNIYWLDIA